ncbi:MAG: family 10 glycosylhydrolase [Bacteroidales bacterium]|nr:family 10 glycosylhydrolase [Bacteroidales bacterium]
MKFKIKKSIFLLIFSIISISSQAQHTNNHELRAVWITTAFNIDWPSSPNLNSNQQQQEFIDIIEKHKQNGINAIFVQIRPSAEVFYESQYEPWSHWLTGKQGKAPEPYYDPLKFMIDECHKRSIEFHAWFNPFRAVSNIERVKTVYNHITRQHPEWFETFGDEIKKIYFNPGIPEARNYIIKIVMEVVNKYDIDGIHFDDYFYPHNENGKSFPDYNTYLQYNKYNLSLADWRRDNINNFIKDLSDTINKINPQIKFGVGPSGVWRNKTSDPEGSDTRGLASYDQQYADVLLWLKEGWIDYVAPQIYWTIGYKIADYQKLVDWWSKHTYGKHLYIGQATHRINTTKDWKNPSEILDQIRLNRKYPQIKGSIFYSSNSLLKNPNGINDSLKYDLYFAYADVPKMEWKNVFNQDTNLIAEADTVLNWIKISRLPQPRSPINIKSIKVRKEFLLTWEMDNNRKKLEADTGIYYKIYKFKGIYADYISEDSFYKQTDKKYIMISRKGKGIFRKRYTFVITAVNKQNTESWPSESVTLKLRKE